MKPQPVQTAYIIISNPPSPGLLENSTPNIQHHLALWENPFFLEGGNCGANPKTKQRPFRPNQLPTDSPHKLSLQDHGTNGQ